GGHRVVVVVPPVVVAAAVVALDVDVDVLVDVDVVVVDVDVVDAGVAHVVRALVRIGVAGLCAGGRAIGGSAATPARSATGARTGAASATATAACRRDHRGCGERDQRDDGPAGQEELARGCL